jgi:hypothetical protein
VQVGVAGGMHIPLAAVEADGLFQEPDEFRRLEIARLPGLDAVIARFPQQQGQPADFQIRAGADHEVGVAGPGDQGGPRLDVVGILARRGGAGDAGPLAGEFQGQGGPFRLAGQDVDGRPGGGHALERQKQGQEKQSAQHDVGSRMSPPRGGVAQNLWAPWGPRLWMYCKVT